jgi:hypothetical protein
MNRGDTKRIVHGIWPEAKPTIGQIKSVTKGGQLDGGA